jgi:hypothetical protein
MALSFPFRIGYFPKPHPDELVYSIIARYISHGGEAVYKSIIDLFGKMVSQNFHLPNSLIKFVNSISNVIDINLDYLIYEHTLFNFFTSFGSIERKQSMFNFIAYGEGKFVVNRIEGLNLGLFKYCVLCAQEDLKLYGETYWHRSHNLPSIECCYKHGCELNVFNSKLRGHLSSSYILADEVIEIGSVNLNISDDQKFIAKSFVDLLYSKERIVDKIDELSISKNIIAISGNSA